MTLCGRYCCVIFVILMLLLSGCATAPQTRQLLISPESLPQQIELSETAFFPQEKYQCGPAALATLLNFSGLKVKPEALIKEIYIPSRQGSLQIEMIASTRRHGRVPYRILPNMSALLTEISAGNPVLVLQNLGLSWMPQWHYAVVIGFDLSQEKIILRSGLNARHVSNMDTFELTWARSNYWAIVIMPPHQLPASAEADRYVRTIASLENVQQWQTAHDAYRTALQTWPKHFIAQIGLGNTAYQLGDLTIAEEAFTSVLNDYPDASAAHNNLAQVLFEQGKLMAAQGHAQQAVVIAEKNHEPHLSHYRQTLKEILHH